MNWNSQWLLFDATQIAWAAHHTTGGLSYNNTPTGVTYGFLAMVLRIQGEFPAAHSVFCFDHGKSLRYQLLPSYKHKRKVRRQESEKEQAAYVAVYKQIQDLKKQHLKAIGFRNVLYYKGFEADDLLGAIARNLPKTECAVIVSSDHDMFQLLRSNVSIYNPYKGTHLTKAMFKYEHGISPRQWVTVKCLAGCSTDDIPGITGVGETSALKYVRGELKQTSVYHRRIKAGIANRVLQTNRPLVELPFEGTPIPKLRKDKSLEWKPTLRLLGIKTLAVGTEPQYHERD